jgi:hypothetical protein
MKSHSKRREKERLLWLGGAFVKRGSCFTNLQNSEYSIEQFYTD